MRAIGEIPNEADALRFGDYLYVEGIPNDIEEDDGEWVVWTTQKYLAIVNVAFTDSKGAHTTGFERRMGAEHKVCGGEGGDDCR
mgnify:CR=1 FL=1